MSNCAREIEQKSCCEPVYVFADASNYYTKQEVDDLIEGISGDTSGVTSGDVETMIEEAINTFSGTVFTKEEITEKFNNYAYIDDNGILHINPNV